jgi:hypothetical protein
VLAMALSQAGKPAQAAAETGKGGSPSQIRTGVSDIIEVGETGQIGYSRTRCSARPTP